MSSSTIYECSQKCRHLLRQCIVLAAATESRDWFECRLADFNVWASSVQAFTTGRSSFDYRLRERQDVRGTVCDLLGGLAQTLELHLAAKGDTQRQYEIQDNRQNLLETYEDDIDISFSDFSEESSTSYASSDASNEAISQYASSIIAMLEQLVRLSNSIRRSAIKLRQERADSLLKIDEYREFQSVLKLIILKDRLMHGTSMTSAERMEQFNQQDLTPVQHRLIHANVLRENRIRITMKSKPSFTWSPQETLARELPGIVPIPEIKPQPTASEVLLGTNVKTEKMIREATSTRSLSMVRTATEIGSQFNLEVAMAKQRTPSIVTRATRIATSQYYPSCPIGRKGESIRCPYCAEPLPKELTTDVTRWRYILVWSESL